MKLSLLGGGIYQVAINFSIDFWQDSGKNPQINTKQPASTRTVAPRATAIYLQIETMRMCPHIKTKHNM